MTSARPSAPRPVEFERIVLCPEQVRGNDDEDRGLVRGRSRWNPVAAPQDVDRSPASSVPTSVARKVVRFEPQLEPNAIRVRWNSQRRDRPDCSRRRKQNNRHDLSMVALLACRPAAPEAGVVADAAAGRAVAFKRLGRRAGRHARLCVVACRLASGSRPPRSRTSRASVGSEVARPGTGGLPHTTITRAAAATKSARALVGRAMRSFHVRPSSRATARSSARTKSCRHPHALAAPGRREVGGLEAIQSRTDELASDIAVNQVRFDDVQPGCDLVVGDAGLVEALCRLVGKKTEHVPVRVPRRRGLRGVAGTCGS